MGLLTDVSNAPSRPSASPSRGTPADGRRDDDLESGAVQAGRPPRETRPRFGPGLVAAAVVAVAVVVGRVTVGGASFPSSLRLPFGDWIESLSDWFVANCEGFYQPVADVIRGAFDQVLAFLQLTVASPTIAVALVAVVLCLGGARLALLTVATLLWVIAVGVWDETLETLAFMTIAVLVSSIIGIVIGVVASTNRRLDAAVRTILDALQAFPSFAYLVPVVVIFGTGDTAALIVTVVWAIPPIARMTAVGIQRVPAETVEAAESVGAYRLQVLLQVKIPMARPSILAGLNQTILYAISMATISALIGGTGLGQPVWSGLSRLEFGQALEPGIALVLIAIIMDRTTQRVATRSRSHLAHSEAEDDSESSKARNFVRQNSFGLTVGAIVVVFAAVAQSVPRLLFANFSEPPTWMHIQLRNPVNDFVTWITVHFGSFLDDVNYNLQAHVLNPITEVLGWLPWPTVLAVCVLIGFMSMGWRGAVFVPVAIGLLGAVGMWEPAIDTLGVVGLSAAISIVVGFPLGVLMSRSELVAALVRPLLDLMQTLPIFLFVIPTVVFLGTGPVAGTLATVCYAIPSMIRFTNVALREADPEVVEAATSVGANGRQLLWQVRVPLGLTTIMVGVNQTILLALAMAVVSAFIGTPGLGQEVLAGVSYADLGRGMEAGFAMFLLAIVVDRVLGGFTRRIGQTHSTVA